MTHPMLPGTASGCRAARASPPSHRGSRNRRGCHHALCVSASLPPPKRAELPHLGRDSRKGARPAHAALEPPPSHRGGGNANTIRLQRSVPPFRPPAAPAAFRCLSAAPNGRAGAGLSHKPMRYGVEWRRRTSGSAGFLRAAQNSAGCVDGKPAAVAVVSADGNVVTAGKPAALQHEPVAARPLKMVWGREAELGVGEPAFVLEPGEQRTIASEPMGRTSGAVSVFGGE